MQPAVRDRPDELSGARRAPRPRPRRRPAASGSSGSANMACAAGASRDRRTATRAAPRAARRSSSRPARRHARARPARAARPWRTAGKCGGELGGDHPPERLADRRQLRQPEAAHGLLVDEHEVRQVVDVVDRVGVTRAGARELRRVDRVVLGELGGTGPRPARPPGAGTAAADPSDRRPSRAAVMPVVARCTDASRSSGVVRCVSTPRCGRAPAVVGVRGSPPRRFGPPVVLPVLVVPDRAQAGQDLRGEQADVVRAPVRAASSRTASIACRLPMRNSVRTR